MNTHSYVRAYVAGAAVPTVFLLAPFAGYCVMRFGYDPQFPMERVIVFPLALVPAIWGLWNMAYLALHGRRWAPLGIHGAMIPVVMIPLALAVTRAQGIEFPVSRWSLMAVAVPALAIIYYLLWKHVVGWLNEMLGIA